MIDFLTEAEHIREEQLRQARTANDVAAVLYPKVANNYSAFVECEASGLTEFPYLELVDLNDDFWAHTLGYLGSETNPIVYVQEEKQFRRYTGDTGIYEPIAESVVIGEVMSNLDLCAEFFPKRLRIQSFIGLRNRQRLKAVVERAKDLLAVTNEFFKPQPYTLAVENGLLDITTFQLKEFSPSHPIRSKLSVKFDPKAKCDLFLGSFLAHVLSLEDIDLVQRYLSQLLEGHNASQTILLMNGESGWGKSSLIKILGSIFGWDQFGIIRDQAFKSDSELTHYQGKRLLIHPDMPTDFLNRPDASLFKQLVGGDPMWAEGASGEMITIEGNFPVVFACNGKPLIKIDSDQAAWMRRLLVVPFKAAEHDQHWGKMVDLIVKNEASGILNWLLDGRHKLKKASFQMTRTAEQKQRTEALLMAAESPKAFVRNCLKREAGSEIEGAELYSHYQKWCVENQIQPFAGQFFIQRAKDEIETTLGLRYRHDMKSKDGTATRGWKHLALVGVSTEK